MNHVFVSCSRTDSEMVDHLVARLNGDVFYVWLDRKDIKGGNLGREEIVEAFDHAYVFVLMLSPNGSGTYKEFKSLIWRDKFFIKGSESWIRSLSSEHQDVQANCLLN